MLYHYLLPPSGPDHRGHAAGAAGVAAVAVELGAVAEGAAVVGVDVALGEAGATPHVRRRACYGPIVGKPKIRAYGCHGSGTAGFLPYRLPASGPVWDSVHSCEVPTMTNAAKMARFLTGVASAGLIAAE